MQLCKAPPAIWKVLPVQLDRTDETGRHEWLVTAVEVTLGYRIVSESGDVVAHKGGNLDLDGVFAIVKETLEVKCPFTVPGDSTRLAVHCEFSNVSHFAEIDIARKIGPAKFHGSL